MSTTLSDLITTIRNRADLTNSEFITDTELTDYINYSLKELHGLLINSYGGDYFIEHVDMTVPANDSVSSGELPALLLKVMGVDLLVSGKYITLQAFNFNERNLASAQNIQGQAVQGATNYRYRIRNRKVVLTPNANGNISLRVWYIPDVVELTTGSQEVDVNDALAGWMEYVIVDVCVKCKQKEETEFASFLKQKNDLIQRIRAEVQNRVQAEPATVSDIYSTGTNTELFPFGFYRGGLY